MSELSDTVAPTFNKVIKQVIKEGDPATDIANAFITDRPGNRIDTSTATLIELNPDAYDAVVLYQDQYGKTAVIVKSNKVVFYGMEVERMDNIGNAALRQTTQDNKMTETNKEEAQLIWEALQEGSPYSDWHKKAPNPGQTLRRGDTLTGKDRTSALFDICPKCNGEGCEHCDGTGRHPKPEEANEGESLDDWNDYMNAEEQKVSGYIQIDLYTGGVQTVSPDEVEQAVKGLEHIPSGQGVSDWDAWKGEEYMVVAVPRTVHWPKTAAYDKIGSQT